jgi:beta-lactamase regulating signal transducer with metallopeptidase domain
MESVMIPPLLDHLWQSTLLALAVGLMALALPKAPAAVRHGLWFAASLKFLIPFAGLAVLGRFLAPRLPAVLHQVAVQAAPAAVIPQAAVIVKAAQPLARFPLTPSPALLQAPFSAAEAGPLVTQALHHPALHFAPVPILSAVWALGFAVVLGRWMVRSAQVLRIVRTARPIAWPAPMPVVASSSQTAPGLAGLWRPVLVTPQTLPERLTRSQIDAIIAHEISHLRRRDNLTAALHTLVEAVFWFHPLVWWIGTRMIVERELACDEAVLRAGHDRRTYARGLVESARLYVQSPLGCVAGASGVDLKTRVERIMTTPIAMPLSRSKKALLLAAASFAFATPVAAGMLTPDARQAAAPLAKAMAAISAPAHALEAAATDQAEATKPVVLARNDVVLAADVAVAANDAAPLGLAPTVASSSADQAARPIEVAALDQPPAKAPSAAVSLEKVETISPQAITAQSRAFVQTYATAPNPELGQIGRWHNPVCVQVEGLAQAVQSNQVKARIESVAQSLGLPAARPGCAANVEIVFSDNPQRTMDDVAKRREDLLGYYHRHDRDQLKAVSHPIQSWYKTSTLGQTANAGLEFPGFNQDAGAGSPHDPAGAVRTDDPEVGLPNSCGDSPRFTACLNSQFSNVFIVVDGKALQGKSLGQVSEYLVMLALSQPKTLDGCAPLPSILDLTAKSACAGRGSPDSLTPADAAWLTALYASDPSAKGDSARSDIAARMATMLIKANSPAPGG